MASMLNTNITQFLFNVYMSQRKHSSLIYHSHNLMNQFSFYIWLFQSNFVSFLPASTAFHSLELGFRTTLVDDCSRGIDHGDIKAAYDRIREANGMVVQSNEVRSI